MDTSTRRPSSDTHRAYMGTQRGREGASGDQGAKADRHICRLGVGRQPSRAVACASVLEVWVKLHMTPSVDDLGVEPFGRSVCEREA